MDRESNVTDLEKFLAARVHALSRQWREARQVMEAALRYRLVAAEDGANAREAERLRERMAALVRE